MQNLIDLEAFAFIDTPTDKFSVAVAFFRAYDPQRNIELLTQGFEVDRFFPYGRPPTRALFLRAPEIVEYNLPLQFPCTVLLG